MKKNPVVIIALGLLLLAAGAVLYATGGPPKADTALAQACRNEVKINRGGDAALAAQCDETAFATALTATDADTAARAISAANTHEIAGNGLAMFCLGLGLAVTIAGVLLRRKTQGR